MAVVDKFATFSAYDKSFFCKVAELYALTISQLVVASHQNAPSILMWKPQGFKSIIWTGAKHDAKVQEAPFNPLDNIVAVTGMNAQTHPGMPMFQICCNLCNKRHCARFSPTNPDVAFDFGCGRTKLSLSTIGQTHDFVRTLSKEHSLFGECHTSRLTHKKLTAHLTFQLRELTRECRLRNVQMPRGSGNVTFSRDGQKRAKCTKFHRVSLGQLLSLMYLCK